MGPSAAPGRGTANTQPGRMAPYIVEQAQEVAHSAQAGPSPSQPNLSSWRLDRPLMLPHLLQGATENRDGAGSTSVVTKRTPVSPPGPPELSAFLPCSLRCLSTGGHMGMGVEETQ